ncbi:MAG TPA: hypothetical protein DCM62_10025 [Bacteroidales bacterium]|nr:hypothetical protein [Bacteroidales bacterium]
MNIFSKNQRLCSLRHKNDLFNKGKTFFVYPFKVFYCIYSIHPAPENVFSLSQEGAEFLQKHRMVDEIDPFFQQKDWLPHRIKLLITVSKKSHKRAIDRNRIKRLIREGYRTNRQHLTEALLTENQVCLLALSYSSRQILPFSEIERKIVVILHRIGESLQSLSNNDIQ